VIQGAKKVSLQEIEQRELTVKPGTPECSNLSGKLERMQIFLETTEFVRF
jgi:hypothetical protein